MGGLTAFIRDDEIHIAPSSGGWWLVVDVYDGVELGSWRL
jgi:hypothetical protein